MRVDKEDCARRTQVIESLRTLAPRIDAARRVYTAGVERRDAVAQENRALEAAVMSIVPPSWPAFGLFIGLIWVGVVGLALAGHEYSGSLVGAISFAAMIWYRDRLKRTAALKQQIIACSGRFETCQAELRQTENQAREIESEIRKLTGQTEITQADIDKRVAELNRLLALSDDVRSIDEAAIRGESELQRITQELAET